MTTVKAGEKWRSVDCGCVLTATGALDSHGRPSCDEQRCAQTSASTHVAIPAEWHTRIEAAPPAVMEADGAGWSVACLVCGGRKSLPLICMSCSDRMRPSKVVALCNEWHAGARDFPRPAPPKVEAKPAGMPIRETPPAPVTCGHPGPWGYGGKCFPCHAKADEADAFAMTCLAPPKPTDTAYRIRAVEPRPVVQSRSLGAGIGVWNARVPR